MLFPSEAELMYPALDGLGGLGCGGDKGCGCGCDSKKKRGLAGPSVIGWSCSTFGFNCPTADEIAKSDENAGGLLTQSNKDSATQMAQAYADAHPCDFSEINGMTFLDKTFKCGQVNWPVIVVVVIGGAFLLKKL